ncbi:uncharacterized protein LOC130674408 isoform X1 [Microplitis mediator]|uniref:uncharacterized protein LOC130674408 isoform X1 n=2 Tax=Microplitis mediator TaxID=375433 RepID=UPI002555294E|nr:uncharacterized protein LOC130674408 isoform X1 [Microplitis mediator]
MINYKNYENYINEIRNYAKISEVSDKELDKIFDECFDELEKQIYSKRGICNLIIKLIKIFLILSFLLFIFFVVIYYNPYLRSFFLRNLQNYIYPGFYIFRKLAVPVITRYPSLTEYYDETCLVENPFFQLPGIDCWPCNTIQTIPNMSGLNWSIPRNFNFGFPFIRQENESINNDLSSLLNILIDNKDIFINDAQRISSNNPAYNSINDLMNKRLNVNKSEPQNTHITWRVNRMAPGRILRKLFPKPSGTPAWWGQSVERFILIDESSAPAYTLPNPECTNIILRSTSGVRLIKMVPSPDCRNSCKPLAIILQAGYTLWYNWLYWRPISYPVINSTDVSVNYLTSFC